MTSGRKPASGCISVIEQMMSVVHEFYGPILSWRQLSDVDRRRLMDAMEAAVEIIPDRLDLKTGTACATVNTGEGRDGLLEDHTHAKKSVLYGQ